MVWALSGIFLGIIIGLSIKYTIPIGYIKYTAVIIIGILDALFGALKEELKKKNYNPDIFLSGLIFNILLALGITFLGEKLGLDLYLAVTVVFTLRIFSNLGIVRRALLAHFAKKKK